MPTDNILLDLPDPFDPTIERAKATCELGANATLFKSLFEKTWRRLPLDAQHSLRQHWRNEGLPAIVVVGRETPTRLANAVAVGLIGSGYMHFRSPELDALAEISRRLLVPDQNSLEELTRGVGRMAEASDDEIEEAVWDLRGIAEGYHELGEALGVNPSPTEAAEVVMAYALGYFYELAGGPPNRPRAARTLLPTGARVIADVESWGFHVDVLEDVEWRLTEEGLRVKEEEGLSSVLVEGLPEGDS